MNPTLHAELVPKLIKDYAFKVSEDGRSLRRGECPSCSKKELYTSHEHPWVLRCGRLNKCGAEFHVKELYPDLFNTWSERHPATPTNPNAAADAYLRDGRGFKLDMIAGWYVQENFWSREHNQGSATVRFQIAPNVWWERIIDKPGRFGNQKANFRGSYAGLWWQRPDTTVIPGEIWITEGIFDAIALMHHDVVATSIMSCTNYPSVALKALAEQCSANSKPRPRLVWALDDGVAGRTWARKFCDRSIKDGWEASAAVIQNRGKDKLDWNDMHQRDRLKEKDLEEYRYQGDLLMAVSASAKANLMYSRHGWNSFPFDFDNRLWWWKLDLAKFHKTCEELEGGESPLSKDEARTQALLKSNTVSEICNCLPTPLYYLKNEVTDEAWYYFRIDFPHDGESEKNTFTSGQLTAEAEFTKRLFHVGAGAIWNGNSHQLRRLLSEWTFDIKKVKTIDYLGYSIEHKAYVFNKVAVCAGRVVELNEEDYFDIGKLAIKSLSRSLKLDINTDLKACNTEWFDKFYLCFGPKGIVSLASWLGSLFSEQIRARFESFPFIEIVGEPGSGKSTMLEFLWRLVGRNAYEGFDPMKGSAVGFMRSMAQVANLPVVLIESDREDDADSSGKGRPKQAFHWDSLKTLYGGGSLRTTGVKSSGNDTYDPQFRAALFISQNATVQASPAIMERIVHIGFDKSRQSEAGREAALELKRLTAHDISGFLVKAIAAEAKVMERMEQSLRTYEKRLDEIGVRNQRIQKNHAMLMVLVDSLSLACPITESIRVEAIKQLAALAIEREQSLAKDHPAVEQFWEAYDYMNGAGESVDEACEERLNHSRDSELIAINLNHFVQMAADMRQQIPLLSDLKRLLKTSRQRKFIDTKTVNSAIYGRYNAMRDNHQPAKPSTAKCWIFQRETRRRVTD